MQSQHLEQLGNVCRGNYLSSSKSGKPNHEQSSSSNVSLKSDDQVSSAHSVSINQLRLNMMIRHMKSQIGLDIHPFSEERHDQILTLIKI